MHPFYHEFRSYLDREDRQKCVDFVLSKLSNDEIDIVTLYDEILTPSLRETFCIENHRAICVWEEHVRTSIVRTVIECCYPYLVKERDGRYASMPKGKVIVVCPTEEYHEIGARMVADFFTLCGFDAVFVGANTPQDDIIESIRYISPDYVAISVTNSYNLVATRRTIQKIVDIRKETGAAFNIIVGGNAFQCNPGIYKEMGADLLLWTFEDIKRLSQGD